jgi:hypothetical protein
MCEEMVVLPLVPTAVGEECVGEMRAKPRRSVECAIDQGVLRQQRPRRGERGVVPYLPIREPLVVRCNDLDARLDDAIANAAGGRRPSVAATRLQQIEREDELEQPDGLQIRAEEWSRGTEHVVAIGIAEVPLGVLLQHTPGGADALAVVE